MRLIMLVSDSMASDLAFLPFADRHRDEIAAMYVVPYVWLSNGQLFRKSARMVGRAPTRYLGYKAVEVLLYRAVRWARGWDSPSRLVRRTGIPLRSAPNVNAPEFVAELAALEPDLVISMIPQIFGGEIIDAMGGRLINVHHALLPEYRGAFAGNFWTLVNGETESGTTVHVIERGVDSGPILERRSLRIDPRDSVYGLHARCARLTDQCLEAIVERLRRSGRLESQPQEGGRAHTYSFPDPSSFRTLRERGRRLLTYRDLLRIGVARPSRAT